MFRSRYSNYKLAQLMLVYLVGLLGAWGVMSPALAQPNDSPLTASVDRTEISIEETLTLRVRYTGRAQTGGQPDFSLLREYFDIISQQQSNQISTVNGVISSFTEWALTLAPRDTGKLLVPSFNYDGHFSDAIEITVTEAKAAPGQLKDVFIETVLEKPEVYVQEQVHLIYRLYTTRSIDTMNLEPLDIENVRVEELPQTRFQRRIDGVNYGVLEVRYALFPLTSDNFTIPPLRWNLQVATQNSRSSLYSFGGSRYELKRLITEKKTVKVAAQPATFPAGANWLPAKNVELTQQWSRSPGDFRVGEPITWTITLRADGLTAAQLPPLPISDNQSGFKLYPDQPDLNNRTTQDGFTGLRTETMAVVPNSAGEITLPAIELHWWDTTADKLRTAKLPAQTYTVQGNPSATKTSPDQATPEREISRPEDVAENATRPAQDNYGTASLWQAATLLVTLLWLLFTFLWWRLRRIISSQASKPAAPFTDNKRVTDEKRALKMLKKASQAQDPAQVRQALLRWGKIRWQTQAPGSLQDLNLLIGDEEISAQLTALDAVLYGDGHGKAQTDLRLDELTEAVLRWRRQTPAADSASTNNLRPLYR